ncbi:Hypothetical_protein [Hexamita inflata]|uniref:Hypothetical_protein n=1 Tax=Hexamita inflata TaxID=28002 RepID=A0AA86UWL9_9EUKA|nr:Hypothetical protein HINF_LOCUS58529 [Hexamita inflata]
MLSSELFERVQLRGYPKFYYYNYTTFYIQYNNRPLEPKFADCINWQICVRFIELYIVTVQTSKRVAKLEFQLQLQTCVGCRLCWNITPARKIFVNKILYDMWTDTSFLEMKALASQNTRQSRAKLKTPEAIQVHFENQISRHEQIETLISPTMFLLNGYHEFSRREVFQRNRIGAGHTSGSQGVIFPSAQVA